MQIIAGLNSVSEQSFDHLFSRVELSDIYQSTVQLFRFRPTVGMAITCGDKLLLTRNVKGPTWGLPQEGINLTHERNLALPLYRGGFQEVGLLSEHVDYCAGRKPSILFKFTNPVPRSRGVERDCKEIVYVAAPVRHKAWVRLNKENDEFAWVDSGEQLYALLGKNPESRPAKFEAICRVVCELQSLNLLSWSCAAAKVMH